jgi:hypothetical protein
MTGEVPAPRARTIPIDQPKVLAGEGIEEVRFFTALLRHMGVAPLTELPRGSRIVGEIQLLPVGGKEQFRPRLKALVNTSGFTNVQSLGIVRDADTDPRATFLSVCDALRAANLTAPQHPLIPAGQNPQVAVLILPNHNTSGMLEDLCLQAVHEDPAMPCVESYFNCLQATGLCIFNTRAKARVQTFLASKDKPGLRLGEAAEAGYWPWGHEVFSPVKEFLFRLFDLQRIA